MSFIHQTSFGIVFLISWASIIVPVTLYYFNFIICLFRKCQSYVFFVILNIVNSKSVLICKYIFSVIFLTFFLFLQSCFLWSCFFFVNFAFSEFIELSLIFCLIHWIVQNFINSCNKKLQVTTQEHLMHLQAILASKTHLFSEINFKNWN